MMNENLNQKNNELTFYVVNNLRCTQMKMKFEIYRFDTLEEALKKFHEFPKEWTSAIGCSAGGLHDIDLVHRVNGDPVKVMDFYNIEFFAEREDVHQAVKKLEEELKIKYQLHSKIHPRRSVLVPLNNNHHIDSYMNNKVLYINPETRSKALFASLNEVYVEGEGWMDAAKFIDTYADQYSDPICPIVSQVNANYMETNTGYLGQCDMSPFCFEHMLKKTKEYHLSMQEKKSPLNEKIQEIKNSRPSKVYRTGNEKKLER